MEVPCAQAHGAGAKNWTAEIKDVPYRDPARWPEVASLFHVLLARAAFCNVQYTGIICTGSKHAIRRFLVLS